MTETIIRWVVNVVFVILAFIWGYREGQVKGYTYYINQSKRLEDNLMGIIYNYEKSMNRIADVVVKGEQDDKQSEKA